LIEEGKPLEEEEDLVARLPKQKRKMKRRARIADLSEERSPEHDAPATPAPGKKPRRMKMKLCKDVGAATGVHNLESTNEAETLNAEGRSEEAAEVKTAIQKNPDHGERVTMNETLETEGGATELRSAELPDGAKPKKRPVVQSSKEAYSGAERCCQHLKRKADDSAETGHAGSLNPEKVQIDEKATTSEAPQKGEDEQIKKDALTESKACEQEGDDVEQTCLKVCAANLAAWKSKTDIWRHFGKCGKVENVFLIKDKWTGASRGVAFITFAEKEGLKAALKLDGTDFGGNVIRVNVAVDKWESKPDTAAAGDGAGAAKGASNGSKGKGKGKGWAGGGGWSGESWSSTWNSGSSSGSGKSKSKGKSKDKASQPVAMAIADKPQGCHGLMARGLSFEATEADLEGAFSACGAVTTRVRLLKDKAGMSKGKAFIDFQDEASVEKAAKLNGTPLKGRKLCLEFLQTK